MADNLQKRPSKGILKNSSSFDKQDSKNASGSKKAKETKWDEMNIIATLHPADKDYGHMKIDEPKTPYNYEEDPDAESIDVLDATELAEKIRLGTEKPPRAMQQSEDEDEDEDLTPEARAKKKDFENKRKKHYNEYYAVKLARKLLEEEEEEEDEDSDAEKNAQSSSSATATTTKPAKSPRKGASPSRSPSRTCNETASDYPE